MKQSTSESTEPHTLAEWHSKYSGLPYHQMDWGLLKELSAKEQKSYRQIAREFNIARNTIKKYTNDGSKPTRRAQPVRDRWRDTVRNIWAYHSEHSDGSKLTARWIFTLLVEKYGYNGSERTVRTLILELKVDSSRG